VDPGYADQHGALEGRAGSRDLPDLARLDDSANADAYESCALGSLPWDRGRGIPGYQGIELLRREDELVEFVTLMWFDSW
jgi:hypothetical protein